MQLEAHQQGLLAAVAYREDRSVRDTGERRSEEHIPPDLRDGQLHIELVLHLVEGDEAALDGLDLLVSEELTILILACLGVRLVDGCQSQHR